MAPRTVPIEPDRDSDAEGGFTQVKEAIVELVGMGDARDDCGVEAEEQAAQSAGEGRLARTDEGSFGKLSELIGPRKWGSGWRDS